MTAQVEQLKGTVSLRKKNWPYPELTADEIAAYQKRIDEYSTQVCWFHSLDLGNGLKTKGFATTDALADRLENLRLPEDMTGLSFLDIAAWDGFYSFEAEQRGAERVLATDYFCWKGEGWGKKGGFLLAREILGSKVEDKEIEVGDLSPERVGKFDIVLFSGIFYHMRDPIHALQCAASVTNKMLFVETHVSFEHIAEPMMGYLPRCPNNENSNYWRPNPGLILLLLKEMGFSRIEYHVCGERVAPLERHGFFKASR